MTLRIILPILLSLFCETLPAQSKVRNLILMIPDGTSLPVLSLARWYQYGACPSDHCRLAVDKHICGLVRTHNSDSPIGDSAPTGSTYATGYLSNTGFVATYPVTSGELDLVPVDTLRKYQPLFTILEAFGIQGRSTGLVATSQFTHATPADFAAHTPFRDRYDIIARQMAHNRIHYVLAGGKRYLDGNKREDRTDLTTVLKARGYRLVNDYEGFTQISPEDSLVFGLFAEVDLPYDLDRSPAETPSLAEMTRKAIQALSRNKKGFFLMVEGSKIDWAAHANDAAGMVTEYLAFDRAVGEAMDFALRDGSTAVIVCSDHGNSGISIGNKNTSKSYDALDYRKLTDPLKRCRMTAYGMATLIMAEPERAGEIFGQMTGMPADTGMVSQLKQAAGTGKIYTLTNTVAAMVTDSTYIGFTTNGHTGEDVILAVYHPGGYRPEGFITSRELHRYMAEIAGIPDLDSLTSDRFVREDNLLAGLLYKMTYPENLSVKATPHYPSLEIRRSDRSGRYARIDAYTDYMVIFDGKKEVAQIPLGSIAVYVNDEKGFSHFFLPRTLLKKIDTHL